MPQSSETADIASVLSTWNAPALDALRGERLELRHEDGRTEPLTIVAVTVAAHLARDGGREPFSLVVRADGATAHFPQGCRVLHHPALGTAVIFLVPIGPDGSGMCYEAVFN